MKKVPVVFKNNNVSGFDVDRTLLMPCDAAHPSAFALEYGDKFEYFRPNKTHVQYLKHISNCGDLVIVWSKNRYQWAELAVKALGLEDYVDIIMCKLTRHIDDKSTFEEIIGNRIYLGDE